MNDKKLFFKKGIEKMGSSHYEVRARVRIGEKINEERKTAYGNLQDAIQEQSQLKQRLLKKYIIK